MTCKHCGKTYQANKKYCTYCDSRLTSKEEKEGALGNENYELDEGFSRPDSRYIEPKVIGFGENLLYQSHEVNTQHEKGKKQQRLSIKLIIGIALAIVIVAVSLLYLNINNREGEFAFISSKALEVYVNDSKFITYVFNTKGDILHKVEKATHPIYSPDHTAVVLMSKNGTNSYYVDANHMIELKVEMNTCNISADGKYILYASSGGGPNYSFLYLYDIVNQKEEVIANSKYSRFDMLNISPGGETITYVTYNLQVENTTNPIKDIESYLIKDGKEPELIGKDILIFAISEDGKNIYSYDYKANILNLKHEEEDEIHLSSKLSNMIYLNRDHSEIMFNDDEATFVSINGNERLKIADSQLDYILAPKNGIANKKQSNSIILYGIESFHNKVILCKDKSLVLITDRYKTKKIGIVSNDPFPVKPVTGISEDGNDLLYIDSNKNLIKVRDLFGKCIQQTLALQVDFFAAAGNLSHVYYSSGHKLYYAKEKEEPVLISENATDLCINQTGDTAYFLENYTGGKGRLLQSSNGSKAEPVSGGESVISVNEWNNGIIYQKTIKEKIHVFYNSQGKEFSLLVDGFYFEE